MNKFLRFGMSLGVAAFVTLPVIAASESISKSPEATVARLKSDLTYLSSDALEGRGIDTAGNGKATEFVRDAFKQMGLKSGTPDGTYFQPFEINGGSFLKPEGCKLTLKGPDGKDVELKLGDDFQAFPNSASKDFNAPIVFVGYGLNTQLEGFNEYKDLNVEGKVVMMMRGAPKLPETDKAAPKKEAPAIDWMPSRAPGALSAKLRQAFTAKAAAVILVNSPFDLQNGAPDKFAHVTVVPNSRIPVVQIHQSLADQILAGTSIKSLKNADDEIRKTGKPQSTVVEKWTAVGAVSKEQKKVMVNNVIGVLEGEGLYADETIVIGGHCDHVGYGARGGSRGGITDQIHNGADDNGSGTVTVMELARRFASNEKKPTRRLVFMAFNGEESGLVGSRYYAENPTYPLNNTVAMFNFDMVGRLREDKLRLNGRATAKEFEELAQKYNKDFHFNLMEEPQFDGRSDHASFVNKKVPVYFFFTGEHPDYHLPSDKVEKINFDGIRRIADYSEALINAVLANPKRPEYVAAKRAPSFIPGLGIVPKRLENGEGLLVRRVGENSRADKAGIKPDDIVVEVAGKIIRTPNDYVTMIGSLDYSKMIEVVILRKGQRINLKLGVPDAGAAKPADAKPTDDKKMKGPPAGATGNQAEASERPRAYLGARPSYGADTKGVLVEGVQDDSPAAKAGIKDHDVITEFDGAAVEDVQGYSTLLRTKKPGDVVKIVVKRGTEVKTLTVTLGSRENLPAR